MAIVLLCLTAIQATFETTPKNHSPITQLPPTLSFPLDGATNVELSPTFQWNGALNATIEIYEGNEFEPGRDTLRLGDYQLVKTVQFDRTLDLSGITYANNRLYMITNRTRSQQGTRREIIVSDTEGIVIKRIGLPAWDDTEDIVYLGGNEFAIAEEKEGAIYRVNISPDIISLAKDPSSAIPLSGTFPDNENDGIEGVSFNPVEDRFYAVDENRIHIHRFDESGSNSGNTFFRDLSGNTSPLQFDDLSAIYHLRLSPALRHLDVDDHFLLLSDDSHKLVETDNNFNDYGTIVLPTPSQFEGVTIDDNGRMYIVGEPNQLRIYENNNCNLSKIPAGQMVHSDNVIGTLYTLPITLEYDTDYVWRIVTDEGCSEFSSFRTMLPPPCNITVTETNITCDDNCTASNPADDTFIITVNATVENGSDFYTVNDGTTTSQPILSGTSVELGPYTTNITADVQLTFADPVNPDCDTTIILPRLPCSTNLQTTVSPSIDSDNNDVYEAIDGTMNLNSTTIQLGEQINAGGFIFRNTGVLQGARIINATLQFTAAEDATDPSTLTISADRNSTPRNFDTFNNDLTFRPMSSQRVQWEVASWSANQRGLAQKSPDISQVLQEIVNRNSFRGDFGIYITGTGSRAIQTHEGGAAATLTVAYTATECPPIGTPCNDGDMNTEKDVENGECCCIGCNPGEPCSTSENSGGFDGVYDENCVCMTIDSIPPMVDTIHITSSEDDVEENGKTGSIASYNSKIRIVRASGKGNQMIGLRFTDVSIPSNAGLTDIYLEFVAENDNNRDGALKIYAEDVNNSPPFDGADRRNVSSREKTITSVPWVWTPLNNWTAGERYRSPNLAPIIEELISKSDWQESGTAITFIIEGTGRRVAKSFDDSPENAPSLHIRYSTNINIGTD